MMEVHDDGAVVVGVPGEITNSSISGYMNFIASNYDSVSQIGDSVNKLD